VSPAQRLGKVRIGCQYLPPHLAYAEIYTMRHYVLAAFLLLLIAMRHYDFTTFSMCVILACGTKTSHPLLLHLL
jgi:hypothetical protein